MSTPLLDQKVLGLKFQTLYRPTSLIGQEYFLGLHRLVEIIAAFYTGRRVSLGPYYGTDYRISQIKRFYGGLLVFEEYPPAKMNNISVVVNENLFYFVDGSGDVVMLNN